jgi:hypothetical protein
MQDRYTADIGDWSKYGLLRALAQHASPQLSLGIVWYLAPPENNTDGRKVGYLDESAVNRQRYAACDPVLYERLRRLRTDAMLTGLGVGLVPQSGVLPPSTKYYGSLLEVAQVPSPERTTYRRLWLQGALQATAGCDIVTFDPDNGLATPRLSMGSATSGKYVFLDELLPFWQRGQSLIIYQHTSRQRGGVVAQTRTIRSRLSQRLGIDVSHVWALRFRTQSSRTYFVVPAEQHVSRLTAGIDAFKATPWVMLGHFVYD